MNAYDKVQLDELIRKYGYDKLIQKFLEDSLIHSRQSAGDKAVQQLLVRTLSEFREIDEEFPEPDFDYEEFEIDPLEVYKRDTE